MTLPSARGLTYMTVLDFGGRIDCARAHELSERAVAALRTAEPLTCDVSRVERPDAQTVDVLARLHLVVKEAGGEMRIYGACHRLRDLIAFMGLEDVLRIEPRRKPEEREEVLGIEEERDAMDLAATDVEDL